MAMKAPLFTADDLEHLPEDGKRYELYEGELVVSPAPIPEHQGVSWECGSFLTQTVRAGWGRTFAAPIEVHFNSHRVVQPDLHFIRRERLHIIGKKHIEGAPELVLARQRDFGGLPGAGEGGEATLAMRAVGRRLPALVIGEQGQGAGRRRGQGGGRTRPEQEARVSKTERQDRKGRPAVVRRGARRDRGGLLAPLSHPGLTRRGGGWPRSMRRRRRRTRKWCARITSVIWWCHPGQERSSSWSIPSSPLPSAKQHSMAQRMPQMRINSASGVSAGALLR